MKHTKTLAAGIALALAATGAFAAGGGGGGDGQFVGNLAGNRADTERSQCLELVGRWYSMAGARMTPPSYECRAHYHGNTNDGAFGRGAAMPTRDDYNSWLLMVEAYNTSDAVQQAGLMVAPGYSKDSPVEWFGFESSARNQARAERNRKKIEAGRQAVMAADPFRTAKAVVLVDPMSRATVKCGDAYADGVAGIKNASMRKAAQAAYDKRCGAAAEAARAKAAAEYKAAQATEPRIIDVSELEQMEPSVDPYQPRKLSVIRDAMLHPDVKSVVIGVATAPQLVLLMDAGSKAAWNVLAQAWPAVREGKLSVRLVPIARLTAVSESTALLLATDKPNFVARAWLAGGADQRLEDSVAALAGTERGTYAEPTPEALAAAKAVVARNTEIILGAGIVGLPVAYYRDDASGASWVQTKVPAAGELFIAQLPLKHNELRYEPALRKAMYVQVVPVGAGEAGELKTQICAKPGGECWMAEGKKKGWFD